MTTKVTILCDECKRPVVNGNPAVKVMKPSATMLPDLMLDFCSYACLAEWAQNEEQTA